MAELKKKKKGHDHSLTDWLKFIIFGCVMLAPFFAILTKCCYVAWNPNAKESYSNNLITSAVKINDNTTAYLIQGNTMTYINNHTTEVSNNNSGRFYWTSCDYDFNTEFSLGYTPDGLGYTNNGSLTGDQFYYFHNPINNTWSSYNRVGRNYKLTFNFVYKNYDDLGDLSFYKIFNIIYNYEKIDTMDNTFYYAVNQLNDEPLFNWTQNTAMYTVINGMTQDLEFGESGNTLATLLTYWSLNTAIYIIFDIVIWAFTKITHILQE